MNKLFRLAATAAMALATPAVGQSREHVWIKGSSAVLPFSAVIAEQFARANPKFKPPVVESGGSSAGLKEFCEGVGADAIDIANASRVLRDAGEGFGVVAVDVGGGAVLA